ncbi:MAG TPA: YceI family protein [Bryobacteraceae bacterium]|nr:YceI family protein [Bryobacteraceae bacterium]
MRNAVRLLIFVCAICTGAARAEDIVFDLDQAQTEIRFTLADVLHTVHGAFQLRKGTIRYDPGNGKAGGEVIVDVASGNTGGGARDRKMHKDVLESSRFPEAVFTPTSVEGRFEPQGTSELVVHGLFQIHGATHELTLNAHIETKGDQLTATLRSELHYTQWGIKNPSTLFLRVSDKVQLDIRATGRRSAGSSAAAVR